jgi:hypothetical protein
VAQEISSACKEIEDEFEHELRIIRPEAWLALNTYKPWARLSYPGTFGPSDRH